MRLTKKVSVWPVAFIDNSIYHGPICNKKKAFFYVLFSKI